MDEMLDALARLRCRVFGHRKIQIAQHTRIGRAWVCRSCGQHWKAPKLRDWRI